MYAVLQVTTDLYRKSLIKDVGFGETLGFGAEMLLIGMATVFSVLILLWGCLAVFKFVFYDLKNKKSQETAEEKTPVPEISSDNQDEEIVAVIAAAISMAQEEHPELKFRVVSFNRK